MKNIFKSTLVAASVALVCGTAYAGNTVVTTQTHSLEGVSAVTTAQTANDIDYVLKAAYAVGDKITFTFTAGSLDTTNSFPAQLNVTADTTSGSEKAGMALGLLNEDANSVTYRVTSLTQPGAFTDKTTIGQTITLSGVEMAAAAVTSGDITVTVDSVTASGDVLDSSSDTNMSRTGKLSQVKTQYGMIAVASTADFDGTIDVAEGRKALTTANDTATFTVSNPTTTGWLNTVTTTGTVVKLAADLAGFDLTKSIGSVATGMTSTVAYSDANKEVTITYAGTEVTTDTITITPPTGTNAVILSAQDFSVSGTYSYGTASTADLGSDAAGSWDLNGAVVNIPYMPYAANIGQIIYVTNSGSLDGDVSVTAFDESGNDYDLGVVASAKAGQVTKLSVLIADALEAAGFTGGKVSMTITVNAQDKDVTVHAGYNVGGADRGTVFTSQYKN